MKTHRYLSGNFLFFTHVLLGCLIATSIKQNQYTPVHFSPNSPKQQEIAKEADPDIKEVVIFLKDGCGIEARLDKKHYKAIPDDGKMTARLSRISKKLGITLETIKIYQSDVMPYRAISGITLENRHVIIVQKSVYSEPENVILAILLHEIGHFQNHHFLTWRCGYPRTRELEADEFVGVNMSKLTDQKHDALLFLEVLFYDDHTYPTKEERTARIENALSGRTSTPFNQMVSAFKNKLYYKVTYLNNTEVMIKIHLQESVYPFKSTHSAYTYLKNNVSKIGLFGLLQKDIGQNTSVFTVKGCDLIPVFKLHERLIYSGKFRLEPIKNMYMEGKSRRFKIDVVFNNGQEIRVDD